MGTVGHVLKAKTGGVHSTSLDTTVFQAVQKMCATRVGALLVCAEGQPVGIFTERDLMTRVILAGRDPAKTSVTDVMSRNLVYIEPSTCVPEAMAVMTAQRCRHLPVMSEGRLVGMISIGDLVRDLSRDQEFDLHRLADYIAGKYPA